MPQKMLLPVSIKIHIQKTKVSVEKQVNEVIDVDDEMKAERSK